MAFDLLPANTRTNTKTLIPKDSLQSKADEAEDCLCRREVKTA